MKTTIHLFNCLLVLCFLSKVTQAQDPLFPNSVVSNDIDFILDTDPDSFTSLSYLGLDDKEMPDSQSDVLFDQNTFIFEAAFSGGETVEIWCHSSFLSEAAAQEYADKLCPRLGKLPLIQRDMLHHVVIHNGDATAFAETEGNFFVLYSDNMDARISTHDLEETVFHESVHATIQEIYGDDPAWTSAQAADQTFVTEYAQSLPDLEDMPETALFAYAFHTYPGRLSLDIENWLVENIPNKLEFFGNLYPPSTVGVNNEDYEVIQAFPNPTKDQVTVILNEAVKGAQIHILNATGSLMKSVPVRKGQSKIELEELPQGIYILFAPGLHKTRIVKQ